MVTKEFNFNVPTDWNVARIGEISKVIGGGTPSTRVSDYWNGNILWAVPTDITNLNKIYIEDTEKKITLSGLKKSSAKILPPYSLLMTSRASIGFCAINKKEICTNQGFQSLIPQKNVDVKFLYYVMQSYFMRKQMIRKAVGTTYLEITNSEVKKLRIPIPPLKEQQKIAAILSTVDEAIHTIHQLIEAKNRFKKGLMQRLFTQGIGHTEFKETKWGLIPKEWEIIKLGDIIEIFDNKRIPLSKEEREKRRGIYPYCGATGIIDYIDGYIFDGEYVLLAEDGGAFDRFQNSAYIMTGKFWVNNHAHIFKARTGVTVNDFLLYILNYLSLIPYVVGTTRQKLNQKSLQAIKIPLPSYNEQKKIGSILTAVDEEIKLLSKQSSLFKKQKRGLMQQLLTGKIRVRVN